MSRKRTEGEDPHLTIDELRTKNNKMIFSARNTSFEHTIWIDGSEKLKDFHDGRRLETGGVVFFGCKWRLGVCRQNGNFCFLVECRRMNRNEQPWSIRAKLKFVAWNRLSQWSPCIESQTSFTFSENDCKHWEASDIDWNTFIQKGLIDDSVIVDMKVSIIDRTGFDDEAIRKFDGSAAHEWNTILAVQDQKFYVLKEILVGQSSYFKTLLNQKKQFKKASMKEIPLFGIRATEFRNLLSVIHHDIPLSGETIVEVYRLADMFSMNNILNKCRIFLMHENIYFSNKFLLRIAIELELEDLKEQVLNRVNTGIEALSMIGQEFRELDDSLQLILELKMQSLSEKLYLAQ